MGLRLRLEKTRSNISQQQTTKVFAIAQFLYPLTFINWGPVLIYLILIIIIVLLDFLCSKRGTAIIYRWTNSSGRFLCNSKAGKTGFLNFILFCVDTEPPKSHVTVCEWCESYPWKVLSYANEIVWKIIFLKRRFCQHAAGNKAFLLILYQTPTFNICLYILCVSFQNLKQGRHLNWKSIFVSLCQIDVASISIQAIIKYIIFLFFRIWSSYYSFR